MEVVYHDTTMANHLFHRLELPNPSCPPVLRVMAPSNGDGTYLIRLGTLNIPKEYYNMPRTSQSI
jgi:hypothetical protein